MLVLTRECHKSFTLFIGDTPIAEITTIDVKGRQSMIGIVAHENIDIKRNEIMESREKIKGAYDSRKFKKNLKTNIY